MTERHETLDQQVRSVMSAPVERIDEDASVAEAAERLASADVGSLLVGETAGILTESDVVESVSDGQEPAYTPVRAVMSAPVVTVAADATLWTAVGRMDDREVKKLPVTDRRRTVGMVTTTDITRALAPELEDVLDLDLFADE